MGSFPGYPKRVIPLPTQLWIHEVPLTPGPLQGVASVPPDILHTHRFFLLPAGFAYTSPQANTNFVLIGGPSDHLPLLRSW